MGWTLREDAPFHSTHARYQFDDELRTLKKQKKGEAKGDPLGMGWTLRESVYAAKERQIDPATTKLPIDELWKLVDLQEGGQFEKYEELAHPKRWQFLQSQKEMTRREEIKKNEKQKARERRRNASRSQSLMNGQQVRGLHGQPMMSSLNEDGDEDEDAAEEQREHERFESMMQFADRVGDIPDTPGTPSGAGHMMSDSLRHSGVGNVFDAMGNSMSG